MEVARQLISATTAWLTLPGLGLAMLSGLAMIAAGRLQLIKMRWLVLHMGLAGLAAALTLLVIVPSGARVLTETLADKGGASEMAERIAGIVNIILLLTIVAVGVLRPRFQFRNRRPRT